MEKVRCCFLPGRLNLQLLLSRLPQQGRVPWHLNRGKLHSMLETSLGLQLNESVAQIAVRTGELLEPLLGFPIAKH
jgi:hypothetical protein